MYVIGATGSGKTTMILSMVNQDIQNGKGVAVIDPHGDLAETLLNCIPDERRQMTTMGGMKKPTINS